MPGAFYVSIPHRPIRVPVSGHAVGDALANEGFVGHMFCASYKTVFKILGEYLEKYGI